MNFNNGMYRGYDRARFKKRLTELGIKDKHTKFGNVFCCINFKNNGNDEILNNLK